MSWYVRILARLRDDLHSPEKSSLNDVALTSVVLVISLTVLIPLASGGINALLLVFVPGVGLGYGVFIYRTDRIFSGIVSAFFALSIFGANVPIFTAVGQEMSLYLIDPIALVSLVVLGYNRIERFGKLLSTRLGSLAVLGFGIFVVWTFLSALAGNGLSRLAAAIFAIQQTRYFVFFITAILIVEQTSAWYGIYPLSISIGGNLLYAIAEVLAGHTMGLTYLGDASGRVFSEFVVGHWTFQTGYFAGGFVGHTRALIGLLLILVPFIIFAIMYGDWLMTVVAILGLTGVAFLVRVGGTDAGWMAFLLELLLIGILCVFTGVVFGTSRTLRGSIASAYGGGLSILLYIERFGSDSSTLTEQRNSSGGTSGATSSGGGTSGATSGSEPGLVSLFARVPGIKVDTLRIRFTQYAAAVDITLTYPVFGIGGYNFNLLSDTYGLPPRMGIHNTFFSHLAATGVPGALAYTISVSAVLALAGYRMLQESGKERLFWGCALTALLGFHAYSFWVVMYGWKTATGGFWAFSGIIIGASLLDSAELPASATADRLA